MPPTILYICGGMAIITIVSYAIFDLSRPYHEREANKEAKRKAKAKAKNKRLTDAVVAYATQKDEETKAFLNKNREPLTYCNPPEDNAESASNETDVPMQADPDIKPNTEDNRPAEVQEIPEEIPEEIPSEELDDNLIIDAVPESAETSEIYEPVTLVHEISHTEDTTESEETIKNLPQDEPELSEKDDFTEPKEEFASFDQAELAPDPTGFNSEANEGNEENAEPILPQDEGTEVQPEDDNQEEIPTDEETESLSDVAEATIEEEPNGRPPMDDFNGKILKLHKTADGLEYIPDEAHQLPDDAWQGYPEIQNTPEGEVHDFEPGAEPGPDNIIQMPEDWYKGVPEETEENLPTNITPLYTEYANQVPDEWKDYPDTEIIPEDTTDKEIPDTDSSISPNNEDPNGHTDEE